MSAGEMLSALADRGFRFEIRGEKIHVEPTPDPATVVQLRARKPELQSYIAEHGGHWPIPLASEHRYVLWSGALDPSRGVCIACGVGVLLHGDNALDGAIVVDDVNSVVLVQASAIVAALAAQEFGETA